MYRVADTTDYILPEELALICPARLGGYSLVRKMWAFFLLKRPTKIAWKESYLQQLQIDSQAKNVLCTLVEQHTVKQNVNDIIASKGSGLIFLLHGPPGSGKTLTAGMIRYFEFVLVIWGKIQISLRKGSQFWKRAKNWNAILLLDEADIFLAKRSAGNIHKNAFVSIFLRQLEYYPGILFLTTNRMDEFDSAFQSRIPLTIKYPALNEAQRTEIWNTNFVEICGGKLPDEISDATFSQLAGHTGVSHLNGQQIKSLIQGFQQKVLRFD
ncbi:P-loop containing nucleoside triphosphate hydrolase protein [Clohesyomyces aquaticus]|uniref:p-loop containing nucleoside triphosphate hydrolase protein n=1 Tax=Clohesyomyces aquaticus TaxID=1231657 RepID=A0A1Y1YBZ7_9PLEO|nr:P-loop containing nucleoside triphosphate hydrolase protein [Clohesyomyces aquaticus]